MQFRSLPPAFLLVVTLAFLAGCSSPAPGPVQPATAVTTAIAPVVTTPDPYALAYLTLLPSEMPFTVVNSKATIPDLSDPAFVVFRATRGYTQFSINQTNDSPSAEQLGQMIVEFPPGFANQAYEYLLLQNRQADQTQYSLTWLPDPRIGNMSCAFVVRDRTGAMKPRAMIYFQKGNIVESVVLISPSPDVAALTQAARLAAAKVQQ